MAGKDYYAALGVEDRKATSDEDAEVETGIAGYIDQIPGCLDSSLEPSKALAERRAKAKSRLSATRREAPRREAGEVLPRALR